MRELISVITFQVDNGTKTSATLCGYILSDGGSEVTDRGFCFNTTGMPVISDNCVHSGTGRGSFCYELMDLSNATTYYVRAFAKNSDSLVYGEEVEFTTKGTDAQACPTAPTVADIDGNIYNTVQIGNQCWMKENLRTTKYADGNSIAVDCLYYPNGDINNVAAYGYLYNWTALLNGTEPSETNPSRVQGICPTGWHVPSSADWTQLTNYVQSQPEYICETCSGTNCIAKSFASINDWNGSEVNCSPGYIPSFNNATGFTVVPSGTAPYSIYNNFGGGAYFWSSSTFFGAIRDWRLENNKTSVTMDGHSLYDGLSISCIKD